MKNRFSGSESGARPGKRFLAWSVMAALLLATAPLAAKERKGAQVVVQRRDGSEIRGELLMVKRDCLVVGEQAKGEIVALGEIGSVRIRKKSKAGTGMLIGFLGGSIIASGLSSGGHSCNGPVFDFGLGALFVGLPAAGLGALIGMGLGNDPILNRDETKPEEFLGKLNRQARVPDASLSSGKP